MTGIGKGASNEWVVAGSRTLTGKPILANDPHLDLSAPILWYLARVVTPEGSVKGATLPGAPVFVLGQNNSIAWGLTTADSNVQDLFIETVDPTDPSKYLTPDGPKPFETREETIHVKGGADVHLTIRATRHGPLLSDVNADLANFAGPDKAVSPCLHRAWRSRHDRRSPSCGSIPRETGPNFSTRSASIRHRPRTWSLPTAAATSAS